MSIALAFRDSGRKITTGSRLAWVCREFKTETQLKNKQTKPVSKILEFYVFVSFLIYL